MGESTAERDYPPRVGLDAFVVDSYRVMDAELTPEEAEAEIGNAAWVVVHRDNGDVVALLARSDIEAGRAAGARRLIGDAAMRVPPTAVVNESATLDDIMNSAIIDILESAHGLVVVRDDDRGAVVGVLPTESIAAYLGAGNFAPPPRNLQDHNAQLAGVPQLGYLEIQCGCGYVNRFAWMPKRQMPACQNPSSQPHSFNRK